MELTLYPCIQSMICSCQVHRFAWCIWEARTTASICQSLLASGQFWLPSGHEIASHNINETSLCGPRGRYSPFIGWYGCAAALSPPPPFRHSGDRTRSFGGTFSHPPIPQLYFGVLKLPILFLAANSIFPRCFGVQFLAASSTATSVFGPGTPPPPPPPPPPTTPTPHPHTPTPPTPHTPPPPPPPAIRSMHCFWKHDSVREIWISQILHDVNVDHGIRCVSCILKIPTTY